MPSSALCSIATASGMQVVMCTATAGLIAPAQRQHNPPRSPSRRQRPALQGQRVPTGRRNTSHVMKMALPVACDCMYSQCWQGRHERPRHGRVQERAEASARAVFAAVAAPPPLRRSLKHGNAWSRQARSCPHPPPVPAPHPPNGFHAHGPHLCWPSPAGSRGPTGGASRRG